MASNLFSHDQRQKIGQSLFAELEPAIRLFLEGGVLQRLFLGSIEQTSSLRLVCIALDYPGFFAALSGLLAARGFAVDQGHICTSNVIPDGQLSGRRIVLDVLVGRLDHDNLAEWLAVLGDALEEQCRLLADAQAAQDEANGAAEFFSHPSRILARSKVLEELASAIQAKAPDAHKNLPPVELEFQNTGATSRMIVRSIDSPFFLSSLASSLLIHRVSIEGLEIRTHKGHITDSFELVNSEGQAIEDPQLIARLRLSVLLTKQFTFFLDRAPDPLRALERFDTLLHDLSARSDPELLRSTLGSPEFQRELAILLGTSDFIWEDFLRLQEENLLPLLSGAGDRSLSPLEVSQGLEAAMANATEFDEKVDVMNEFKDRQSYLIDLDHILGHSKDFYFLSDRLSALADSVLRSAFRLAEERMISLHGRPRSAAGLSSDWVVCGLGKLGGRALGYASDIELLCLWADDGESDGESRLANREWYERFFSLACSLLRSRREGIFELDLRLRPHGEDGPLAVKLENFASYYAPGPQAHSAERLALLRLRPIAGSEALGLRVMAVRDQLVYESDGIRVPEIRELRALQIGEKLGTDTRINAKFSPGGLVDVEYNVQLLQVRYGREHPELRVSEVHRALEALADLGSIEPSEAIEINHAYRFFRTLINALRMLRGNAQDLFLPEEDDVEYQHLARRCSYENSGGLTAAQQLKIDLAEERNRVTAFVERYLGREAIPGNILGSPLDLVLNPDLHAESAGKIVSAAGFRDVSRALVNLRSLAGSGERRRSCARLLVLAWNSLSACPDPDMALNNWERFVRRLDDPAAHFGDLLSQHKRLDILLRLFSASQFLSDTLERYPAFFTWITDPKVVGRARSQEEMQRELEVEAAAALDRNDWIRRLCRFRKREILRIGLRDLVLGIDIAVICDEISALARAACQLALQEAARRLGAGELLSRLSVLAFGKLGGGELNYSSDIDLLCVWNSGPWESGRAEEPRFAQLFRSFVQDLGDFSDEGQAYRVDLRLRPHGDAGELVSTLEGILEYYASQAEHWEFQALLKLKPLAGNLALGEEFLDRVKPLFLKRGDSRTVRACIKTMRQSGEKEHTRGIVARNEVKNGPGGIRDVEFIVQGMQMIYAAEFPQILCGGTLKAIEALEGAGCLDQAISIELAASYRMLRRVEHYLQLYEDRQLHAIPEGAFERDKLARTLDPALDSKTFWRQLAGRRQVLRGLFRDFVAGRPLGLG